MNSEQKKELRQEIRQKIQKIYFDLIGASLDSKTVSYWERSVMSGDKTLENFINFVTCKPEYKSQMKSRFSHMYYDIIGYDLDNDTIEIFINTQCKNHAVSSQELKKYITNLPLFYEKYSDLIRNVYMKIYDEEPSAEILEFYLKVIKQRDEYDIEKLYDDMSKKLHDEPDGLVSSQ